MYRFFMLCFLLIGCSKKDDPTPINETLIVDSARMQIHVSNGNINVILFYVGTQTIQLFRNDLKDASMTVSNDIVANASAISAYPLINEYILISSLNDGQIEINAGTDVSQSGGVKKVIIKKISELSVDAEQNETAYIADPVAGRNYARGLVDQAKSRPFSLEIY